MDLPVLFNEKIKAIAALPLDAHINWQYQQATPFHKPYPRISFGTWMAKEIGNKPCDLELRSSLGIKSKDFLKDLKTRGSFKLETENYSMIASNYQELTLTDEVREKLKSIPEELSALNPLKAFACYFEVTLIHNGYSASQKFLYVPGGLYDFFEDVLLPHFFSTEEASFIRNSLIEYIYYTSLPKPRSLLNFKPRYRLTLENKFSGCFSSKEEVTDVLAHAIKKEIFKAQYRESQAKSKKSR